MYEKDWEKYNSTLKDWDYEKNERGPYTYAVGSAQRAYWRCPKCKGSYRAEIRSRTKNGTGCPFCSNKKVLVGYNDLAHVYPLLLKEWDYDKNTKKPDEVTKWSRYRAWWKCPKCNGEWSAEVYSRTALQTECPFCTNRKVLTGFNDLKTKHPELISEWDYEKNKDLPENIIGGGGGKSAWWKCRYGHSWYASINNRVYGSGCPTCTKRKQSSFPEQALFYYIKQRYTDAINSYKDIFKGGMEIDIYIPSLKTGIEYDGRNWHKSKKFLLEEQKYKICKSNGIKLIRIKENREHLDANCDALIYCDFDRLNYADLDKAIRSACRMLGLSIDVDTKRDSLIIRERYLSDIKERSLQKLFPEIAREWHPTKNGNLTPDMFEFGSIENVWWKCPKCNGEWRTTINLRTNQKTKCPFCSGKKVLKGFNDLATVRPDLVPDWDYDKNTKKPDEVTKGSGYYAWWKCHKCNHEWRTKVDRRGSTANTGCPNCYKIRHSKKK